MRRILFFILLLFLGCQLTAVNGQHSSDTIVNVSKSQYVKDLFLQAEKSWFSGNFDDACEKCFKVIEYVEKNVKKRELDRSFYKPLAHAHYCIADIFISSCYGVARQQK